MTATTAWWLALVSGVMALPVVLFAGWPFLKAGWRTLLAGVPGMDFLIGAGSLAAFVHSAWQLAHGHHEVYFDTASMLVTFLLAGRLIEASARRKGLAAIHGLLELAPEQATCVAADGGEVIMTAAAIPVGGLVRIRPGERIAVDGCIEQGRSLCDRSLLTGEADWLPVGPGDAVEAGTLNGDGALLVRVTAAAGERLLDRIGTAMRQMLMRRSAADLVVSRLLRWFVPAVCLLAIASGIGAGLLAGNATAGVVRAVAVLVIACPCALGLAGPMAVLVAAGLRGRAGPAPPPGHPLP
jgi:cation transport ATPase